MDDDIVMTTATTGLENINQLNGHGRMKLKKNSLLRILNSVQNAMNYNENRNGKIVTNAYYRFSCVRTV